MSRCFFKADKLKVVHMSDLAFVFAQARLRQVRLSFENFRLRSSSYDETRPNNILKRHQKPTATIQITKAGSIVNI
jgi:hypothetical protein